MKIIETAIRGVFVIEPRVISDSRGFFLETHNEHSFAQLGITDRFVQDNQSHSKRGVLRGFHFQTQRAQGKLVRVVTGEVFDVAVDLRSDSLTFGKWVGAKLSAADHHMMWIPKGFAHGFYVLSETSDMIYKVTDFYAPEFERTLAWNDPDVGVDWPLRDKPILSEKDQKGMTLKQFTEQGILG